MFVRIVIAFILAVGVFMDAGCSRGRARLYPPSINASSAGAKAIEMYDTDKDGKLSGAELDKCPALKAALAQIDASGEGAITAAKITARIKQWQESRIGRMRLEWRPISRPMACATSGTTSPPLNSSSPRRPAARYIRSG